MHGGCLGGWPGERGPPVPVAFKPGARFLNIYFRQAPLRPRREGWAWRRPSANPFKSGFRFRRLLLKLWEACCLGFLVEGESQRNLNQNNNFYFGLFMFISNYLLLINMKEV